MCMARLRLGGNQLGDAAVGHLISACASGALPRLERVGISGNDIGDAGATARTSSSLPSAMITYACGMMRVRRTRRARTRCRREARAP